MAEDWSVNFPVVGLIDNKTAGLYEKTQEAYAS
jgi:hypothetical protein